MPLIPDSQLIKKIYKCIETCIDDARNYLEAVHFNEDDQDRMRDCLDGAVKISTPTALDMSQDEWKELYAKVILPVNVNKYGMYDLVGDGRSYGHDKYVEGYPFFDDVAHLVMEHMRQPCTHDNSGFTEACDRELISAQTTPLTHDQLVVEIYKVITACRFEASAFFKAGNSGSNDREEKRDAMSEKVRLFTTEQTSLDMSYDELWVLCDLAIHPVNVMKHGMLDIVGNGLAYGYDDIAEQPFFNGVATLIVYHMVRPSPYDNSGFTEACDLEVVMEMNYKNIIPDLMGIVEEYLHFKQDDPRLKALHARDDPRFLQVPYHDPYNMGGFDDMCNSA